MAIERMNMVSTEFLMNFSQYYHVIILLVCLSLFRNEIHSNTGVHPILSCCFIVVKKSILELKKKIFIQK